MKVQRDTVLGIVFFAGLGLILVATAQLKDWTAFRKPYIYPVFFPSAEGLRAGDPVTVYGMRAGRVKDVELNPSQDKRDKRIVVTLELKDPIPFRENVPYEIAIEDSSFLGGKVVTVDPEVKQGGIPYRHDEPLRGISFTNPMKQLSSFFSQSKGDLEGIFKGIATLVRKANSNESTIGALFNERKLYDSVYNTFKKADNIVTYIQDGKGTVGALIKERKLYDKVLGIVDDVKKSTKALNERKGLLSRLIHDERMGEDASAIVEDIRAVSEKIRKGQGTLGKLISNDDIYEDLKTAIRNGKDLLAEAKSGKGIIGRLVSDESLGKRLTRIVTNVDDIVASLSTGQGTLGKLIRDDSLYIRLNLVFAQISRAVEDAREAAPVSTFIQVLGSTFR